MTERQGKRKSIVSFKLDSGQGYETPMDNHESPDEFYLPKHYSTVEEKLDAWRDSSRNSNNRFGTPSSFKRNSSTSAPETLMDSRMLSDFGTTESESSFSCCSQQEAEKSYSRNSSLKPSSGLSLLSNVVDVDDGGDDNDDLDDGEDDDDGCGDNDDLDDGDDDNAELDDGDDTSDDVSVEEGSYISKHASGTSSDLCLGDIHKLEVTKNEMSVEDNNLNMIKQEQTISTDKMCSNSPLTLDNCSPGNSCSLSDDDFSISSHQFPGQVLLKPKDPNSSVVNEDCSDDKTSDSQNAEEDKEMNTPPLFKTLRSRSLDSSMNSGYTNRYSPMEDMNEEIHDTENFLEQGIVKPNLEIKQDLQIPKISLNLTKDKKIEKENQKHDGENEEEYISDSESSLMEMKGLFSSRRHSSIVSFALDSQKSSIMGDVCEEEAVLYDMTKKASFDIFKEFLLGTNGEKYFNFWLEAECAKHFQCDDEKAL